MASETRLLHREQLSYARLTRAFMVLMALLQIFYTNAASAQCGSSSERLERHNKLAMYKVTLKTYWSRARFPRHYPEWRPPAQFGKLVGRTHDPSYVMYRLGQRLSSGARQYVETGTTDGLDTASELPNLLHSFTGPAITQGEGTSIARAFLDGNHTYISVFARINPSPDWFVGVDSFQLCVENNWVDSVTVELDPLDGGTDNGFTFTSANWPTQPQGIAYRITSRYPAHAAGSFFYPNLPRLPPIATLTFTKLREYTLTEIYHNDDAEVEFVSNVNLQASGPTPMGIDPNRDLSEAIDVERREMNNERYRYSWASYASDATNPPEPLINQLTTVQQPQRQNDAGKAAIIDSIASSYAQNYKNYNNNNNLRPTFLTTNPTLLLRPPLMGSKSPEAQKAQIYADIQKKLTGVNGTSVPGRDNNNYYNQNFINNNSNNNSSNNNNNSNNNGLLTSSTRRNLTGNSVEHERRYRTKHHRLFMKGKRPGSRGPRDCKVGDWNAWSACSRTCGVGETQRTRKVLIKPRRGGAACPPLKQTKWCGSVNPCPETGKSQPNSFYW